MRDLLNQKGNEKENPPFKTKTKTTKRKNEDCLKISSKIITYSMNKQYFFLSLQLLSFLNFVFWFFVLACGPGSSEHDKNGDRTFLTK